MLSTLAIAVSMSADAFAASLGKGAALEKPSMREALRVGLVFGSVEAVTPLLGWACGILASTYVAAVDHWIAFGLLGAVGLKMIADGLLRPPGTPRVARHSSAKLVLTAIGTSIDAFAVGVSLSFIGANILVTSIAIGMTTCIVAAVGLTIGRFVGARIGVVAEVAGGLILIGLGSSILVDHLGLLA